MIESSVTNQPHTAHAEPEPIDLSQASILLVDDNQQNLELMQAYLEELPYQIRTARDGVEAVEMIDEKCPDLVLLDVMMPRMSGFEVCQKLRSNIQTAFIPIMMLTGNTDEESRTRGFLVGTDDYMGKPFSVPELHARVSRLLRRTYGL